MYEAIITRTAKLAGSSEEWETFDDVRKVFRSEIELRQWIKDNYGGMSSEKMYCDSKNNTTNEVGRIYKIGLQKGDSGKYYQRDWVSYRQFEYKNPIKFNGEIPVWSGEQ